MKNIFFFSIALLNGALLVAGDDVPTPTKSPLTIPKILVTVATQTTNTLEIETATLIAAVKDMAEAPRDSYSGFIYEDSSYKHRPYSPVTPNSPGCPIKNMATAPADSYSGYVDEDSALENALSKNLAAQIVINKVEEKNNPIQQQSAAKKDSIFDQFSRALGTTDLARAFSDSYGSYIPDEKAADPVERPNEYQYQSIDAI